MTDEEAKVMSSLAMRAAENGGGARAPSGYAEVQTIFGVIFGTYLIPWGRA